MARKVSAFARGGVVPSMGPMTGSTSNSSPMRPRPAAARSADEAHRLTGGRVLLLALIAGTTVASPYYCQPVLASLGTSLGMDADAAGWVVVAALLGNAFAQFLVVPLVDRRERRRLTRTMLGVQLLGLVGMAAAPNLAAAVVASAVVGVGASGAMTLVPYAVGLAAGEQRGRVTGAVMSGVLFGILLSRSASGFLSARIHWRTVYVVAAVLCVAATIALRSMPRSRGTADHMPYRRLLRSLPRVVSGDRLVRRHMALGALGFVSFNLLWTGLTLLLSGTSHNLSDAAIGLFGLLGAAGAMVARNAGRLHDGGHARRTLWWGWIAMTAAWPITAPGSGGGAFGLIALILGVLLLDTGMQAQHITNQSILLSARAAQAGRVTTVYRGTNVIAGAAGSTLATRLFPVAGWTCLAAVGLGCGVLALAALGTTRHCAHDGEDHTGSGRRDGSS